METLHRFKEKIDAMQKYVPLLRKLITQLEKEDNTDTESTEKITQLKILLHQLTDPKPDISVEELEECDRVLEKILHLQNHVDGDFSASTTSEKNIKNLSKPPDDARELHLTKKRDENKMENSEHLMPIKYKVVKKIEGAPNNKEEKREFIVITEKGGAEAEVILPDNKSEIVSSMSKASTLSKDNQITQIKTKDDIQVVRRTGNKAIKRASNPIEKEVNESTAKKSKISTDTNLEEIRNVEHQAHANSAMDRSDPLFVESVDESLLLENIAGIFNDADDDDDDDVQIIENRSSPILIESDDDTNVVSSEQKTVPLNKGSKKCFIGPKSIKQRMQLEENLKSETKRILNNIQQLKGKINTLKNKSIPVASTPKSAIIYPTARTPQSHFLSKIDLQPKNNPRHFTASVGNKSLQIPNAFYNAPPTVNPDAAHCLWLDNFLKHFCSPYNTADNTCFLLLQRALRQDDFTRIRQQRKKMQPNGTEVDQRLLIQLRNIFYIDGDPAKQKLTFVGRKFCQLAFVNILNKTIALTVDTRTHAITSRSRISTTTLNAARTEKSATVISNMPKTIIPTNQTNIPKDIPPAKSSSGSGSTVRNCTINSGTARKKKDDKEYCPPRDISQVATDNVIKPRRSLRTTKRNKCFTDSMKYLTYSDDDDEAIDEIEKYIAKKRLDAEKERQQKAQSFETAFVDTIKQNPNPPMAGTQEVSKSTAASSTIQTKAQDHVKTFVISDDDDDQQSSSTKQPIPNTKPQQNTRKPVSTISLPKPAQTTTTGLGAGKLTKNTDEKVHSMSKFNDFCLICNCSISRVVSHYVNTHPDSEVFTSRPAPKMAKSLLKNELGIASYDNLRGGLTLYVATCVFCERKGSFTLAYWYHHFASHTGEYAYKCNGCGLRRPTRAQLTNHIQQICPMKGDMEITQQYDFSLTKICAYICRLCNYTQMSFANVLKHLKTQHCLLRSEKRFWDTVVLLEIPKSTKDNNKQPTKTVLPITEPAIVNNTEPKRFYVHNSNGDIFEIAEIGHEDEFANRNEHSPVVVNEAEFESNNDSNWSASVSGMIDVPLTDFEVEPQIKQEFE